MIPGGPDTASDSGLRACFHFPASPKPAPVETISSRVACRDARRAWVWHSQWAGLRPRTARSRDGRTRTPTSSRPRSAPDCSRRLSTPRPSSASTTRHRADDAPINAALYGPFEILAFPEPAETDVVYADSLMSTVYYEQPVS